MKIVLPDPEDTQRLGFALGRRVLLQPSWGKNVFLFGDIGIGKTTFLKGFARGLGVSEHINSPTFALVSEYKVPSNVSGIQTFSHLDIFRVEGDSVLALPEIFEKLEDATLVLALEWAEKLPKNIFPGNRIEVRFCLRDTKYDEREVELEFFDSGVPDDTAIKAFLEECKTPLFIRKHTALVAKVAMLIAKRLIEKGSPVHFDLVRASALLHDLFWMCSHSGFSRNTLPEKVDDGKWDTWASMRNENQDQDAFMATASYIRKKGYASAADMVSRLRFQKISGPYCLEEACLVLAHHYVFQEKALSLAERFRLEPDLFAENIGVQSDLLRLEKEISDYTGLLPEEIVTMEY